MLKFGLTPLFKTILLDESPVYFKIFSDESFNKNCQKGQTDILIRLKDDDNKEVETGYFDSSFLDGFPL